MTASTTETITQVEIDHVTVRLDYDSVSEQYALVLVRPTGTETMRVSPAEVEGLLEVLQDGVG